MIFLRPVGKNFPITQRFGENPQDYPLTNGHNGIDYGVPNGTRVLAAAAGQVVRAELDTETAQNPKAGYGMHVRIQHPDHVLTLYGHLSETLVRTGQMVQMGEPIGISDNTGRSTGPHLHFEVRTDVAALHAIDPAPFMTDEMPSDVALFSVQVTPDGDGLRVRAGPGTNTGVVRSLRSGDTVQILGISGADTWLRVEDGFILFNPSWVKMV